MSILKFKNVEEVKAHLEQARKIPFNFDTVRQLEYYIRFFDSLHTKATEEWNSFGKYMNLPE